MTIWFFYGKAKLMERLQRPISQRGTNVRLFPFIDLWYIPGVAKFDKRKFYALIKDPQTLCILKELFRHLTWWQHWKVEEFISYVFSQDFNLWV